jgi:methionine-rich copper-binding protein CopC
MRRLFTVVVVALGAFALGAPAASAHAKLLSTSPGADATVGPRVGAIVLRFDDVIKLVPRSLVVTGATGAPLTTRPARVVDGRALTARLTDELAPGRYFVVWRILADDGHIEGGSFGFTVVATGAATTPTSASTPPASPQPVWPVVVASCLAAVAIGGAALVVRRGLVAVQAAGRAHSGTSDDLRSPSDHMTLRH